MTVEREHEHEHAPDEARRTFWQGEHTKFVEPHFRLQKMARIINDVAGERPCDLLDVGCGPATLARLLRTNISYHGVDLVVQDPSPHLLEIDFLASALRFHDKKFDVIVAQGIFEYLGALQAVKMGEIAEMLLPTGRFIATYTNFAHRRPHVYHAYNNVQPLERFQADLAREFTIDRSFPASYNWSHGQPNRWSMRALQMPLQVNLPVIGRKLAVDYFFVCSRRDGGAAHVSSG